MSLQFLWAALIAFAVAAILSPLLIPVLIRLKVGNTEREELESHLKKAGTPTMGGIMILAGFLIGCLPFVRSNPQILPVMILTIGFGLIGFTDDYLKVVKRKSDGLLPKQKMLLEIIVTAIFTAFLLKQKISLELYIPFAKVSVNIGWAAIVLLFFAVIGTVNGTNFTDGVDGLAATVTVVVCIFFAVASLIRGGGVEAAALAMMGGLMGFLLFNAYPAKVFMGDTGSLALGGFVAGCAYMMQMPLFILIVGIIYVVEVLSVMIQVAYFKKTGGKRIFKMAPIHHHFELSGWSETKVVAVFSIITGIACLIAVLGL